MDRLTICNKPEYLNKIEPYVTGMKFPMALKDITRFEKESNISVSVFSFHTKLYSDYITQETNAKNINLL